MSQDQALASTAGLSNVEIVHTALDFARARQLDKARPYFADDLVLHVAEGLPYGGVYHGWDGYTEVLRKLKAFWAETNQDSREFLPLGADRVFVHFMLRARIASNNQPVEMPVVAIWEIRDGKIARIINFYFDTRRIAELAALP
jgi:ketosteroid isomerase-like protein